MEKAVSNTAAQHQGATEMFLSSLINRVPNLYEMANLFHWNDSRHFYQLIFDAETHKHTKVSDFIQTGSAATSNTFPVVPPHTSNPDHRLLVPLVKFGHKKSDSWERKWQVMPVFSGDVGESQACDPQLNYSSRSVLSRIVLLCLFESIVNEGWEWTGK